MRDGTRDRESENNKRERRDRERKIWERERKGGEKEIIGIGRAVEIEGGRGK